MFGQTIRRIPADKPNRPGCGYSLIDAGQRAADCMAAQPA